MVSMCAVIFGHDFSAQISQEKGGNLLCCLKERKAELEDALEEQREKTANAVKALAEEEIVTRDLAKKSRCILNIKRINR